MFASKDTLLTRPSGYSIARSVRLRSSATAYLSRTPSSTTNRRTWTWSGWMKRGTDKYSLLFAAGNVTDIWNTGTNCTLIGYWINTNQLVVYDNGTVFRQTQQVFRDFSAWYHIVVAFDTTQATAANRLRVYINGAEVTSWDTNAAPTQNLDMAVNVNQNHFVGGQSTNVANAYFDGYLTEINFVDGQQLTPSSFGETDSITGVWKPKAYSGTYGTNGFYLNFSDNSNNTAATIGKDYSGNGNNWTPNNVQTYDSVPDTPSNNFCVMNPLYNGGSGTAWLDGNLKVNVSSTQSGITASTFAVSSGKWYWEIVASPTTPPSLCVGIIKTSFTPIGDIFLGYQSEGYGYYSYDGRKVNNSSFSSYGSSWEGAQFVIGIALDMDAGTIVFYRNNVSQGTAFSSLSGLFTFAASDGGLVGTTFYVNFGADSSFAGQKTAQTNTDANGLGNFFYAVPSGYLALCTQNLPASTITNGAAYMNTLLYTGDGNTTKSITGLSFAPDFVWHKTRSNADDHRLVDIVRGGGTDLSSSILYSNLTNAQDNSSGYITQTSSGFDLGVAATPLNMSGRTYVAWNWKANGAGVSNTNGTITSTVSVGATQGFSVVTFTAPASGNFSAGHGLGVTPGMVITKVRGRATNWITWHNQLNSGSPGTSYYVDLNLTGAQSSFASVWGSTGVTSSVIGMGVNASCAASDTIVAYCFAAVAGYSAFGSYTGNGSADGPFIYTGFRPRFVLYKITSAINDWEITDSSRNGYNGYSGILFPDLSNAEGSYTSNGILLLSNGFKFNGPTGSGANGSGQTYIYMAFAENPFKYALAR